jgi:RNA polymerase sigma-70 factor (ECF subfamily)
MSNAQRDDSEQCRPAGARAIGLRHRAAARDGDAARNATGDAVARANHGHLEALRYRYAGYADNVQSDVVAIPHDHHDAEDVTQQVFAKLISALTSYEDHGAPFRGWLLRLARIARRHLGGFAHAEIAARLRRGEGAIHALHHRGRSALRAELRRLGVAPVTRAAWAAGAPHGGDRAVSSVGPGGKNPHQAERTHPRLAA